MVTASSRGAAAEPSRNGAVRAGERRLIRQASAWLPSQPPRAARLQDLEGAEAIRWVDLSSGSLRDSEARALLDPVCGHELTPRMARDLITPARYPAERRYDNGPVTIAAGFRIRHVQGAGGRLASLFEPVHLLSGEDWLLTCWLPPRVYRGLDGAETAEDHDSNELYEAVARGWLDCGGETAFDLAHVARAQLAAAGAG